MNTFKFFICRTSHSSSYVDLWSVNSLCVCVCISIIICTLVYLVFLGMFKNNKHWINRVKNITNKNMSVLPMRNICIYDIYPSKILKSLISLNIWSCVLKIRSQNCPFPSSFLLAWNTTVVGQGIVLCDNIWGQGAER